MPERYIDQDSPDIETIANVQRSITATLTYIMGRASVAELFGLQAYLSNLASHIAPVDAVRHGPQVPWDEALWDKYRKEEMPAVLRQQLAEIERNNERLRVMQEQANSTPAQYRQKS